MMGLEQMPLLNENKIASTRRWLITPQPLILAIFGTILVNCMYTEARSTPSDQNKSLLDAYSPDSIPLTPNSIPLFYTNYYQDNNYNTNYAAGVSTPLENIPAYEQRTKRRLVVRVPFAQNPDTTHLSRIYRQLFTQQKQKKLIPSPGFGYSIRHFIV